MTLKQIKEELDKIYQERTSWNCGKGPFDGLSVNRRELVLIKQQVLYHLEDVKCLKDKHEELFYFRIYKMIGSYGNII